jgi:anhydro-N-acetylmuramic acid kinase
MNKRQIIGLMSGTSMDGLDIALVEFSTDGHNQFTHEVIKTQSVEFPAELRLKLSEIELLSSSSIFELDKIVGYFLAEKVNEFVTKNKLTKNNIAAIASHGQTLFHQPQAGYTVQIGCGQTIAHHTGMMVINDFRTRDIIAGGQGAPLVPIGDFALFNNLADSFLNIGGFANISFRDTNGIIRAFDVCPGNLPLNKLVLSRGLSFDENGNISRSGDINFFLLDLLNSLPYYTKDFPKSLGTEWLEEQFYPLLKFDKEIETNLRTVVEHIAIQIAQVLNAQKLPSVLVSGGGAKNTFLIERIEHYYTGKVIIPNDELVEFKEAIIFAFLGYLYLENKPNCLAEVTGASHSVRGGTLHYPQ